MLTETVSSMMMSLRFYVRLLAARRGPFAEISITEDVMKAVRKEVAQDTMDESFRALSIDQRISLIFTTIIFLFKKKKKIPLSSLQRQSHFPRRM